MEWELADPNEIPRGMMPPRSSPAYRRTHVVVASLGDGWRVFAAMVPGDAGLVVSSMRVEPAEGHDPRRGLRTSDLRAISYEGAAGAVVRADRDRLAEWGAGVLLPSTRRRIAAAGKQAARGRTAEPDFLAGVALRYLRALFDGDGGRVNVVVAEYLREEGVEDATPGRVRDWVRAARRAEWMTYPGGHGQVGGEATPKLREWVKRNETKGKGKR